MCLAHAWLLLQPLVLEACPQIPAVTYVNKNPRPGCRQAVKQDCDGENNWAVATYRIWLRFLFFIFFYNNISKLKELLPHRDLKIIHSD